MLYFYSVNFDLIDTNDILDIHNYLMKRRWHKMFGLIKKIFIRILTGPVNGSNHKKCISLSNQKCMTQLTLIDLHPKNTDKNFTTIRL